MSKLENGPEIVDFELHFFSTTMFDGGLTKKYIMYEKNMLEFEKYMLFCGKKAYFRYSSHIINKFSGVILKLS